MCVTALIGILATTPRPGDRSGLTAINRGFFISAAVSAVLVAIACFVYLPSTRSPSFDGAPATPSATGDPRLIALGAVLIGLVLAAAIQLLTGYFTETNRRPVLDIAKSSLTGPATTVLAGISVGLESAVYSAILIGAGVYGAYLLGSTLTISLFCVALAGTGLLTTVGVIVSMDTFGPVSDNAQGIAEMSGEIDEARRPGPHRPRRGRQHHQGDHQGHRDRDRRARRDRAVRVVHRHRGVRGAKAGASVASDRLHLAIAYPDALVGLILGAAVVFLFSGLAINAVSRAAGRVVFEVREQFRTRPGIMAGTERPDYGRVVDICTKDSLRELITPGTLAVLAPIAVGFGLGFSPLGAFLVRRHRRRCADGGVPVQLRWGLGQRQEARRGRQLRRQGLRRRTPPPSSATPSVTRSRTPPARPSTR